MSRQLQDNDKTCSEWKGLVENVRVSEFSLIRRKKHFSHEPKRGGWCLAVTWTQIQTSKFHWSPPFGLLVVAWRYHHLRLFTPWRTLHLSVLWPNQERLGGLILDQSAWLLFTLGRVALVTTWTCCLGCHTLQIQPEVKLITISSREHAHPIYLGLYTLQCIWVCALDLDA